MMELDFFNGGGRRKLFCVYEIIFILIKKSKVYDNM